MTESTAKSRSIGRYVLGEILGRGAMGIVYKADDPLIARTVAVKLLHMTRALSPEQAAIVRERFMREAQTAGNLDHPNIVRVFDVGFDDESGDLYLVMDYLPGPSLEERMLQGAMPREQVADLIRQIGSALDAAHARGVIHRDVKPANILFAADGTPKITDFGIARITSSHLTQDMRELGTPVYMSPEQITGKTLDGRSDLFSLGVMAYQLLAGVPPFSGRDTVSLAYQIVHSTPPPLSAGAPGSGVAVDRVMFRILAKDPVERHGSGREFHQDLAQALLGPSDAPQQEGRCWAGFRLSRRAVGLFLLGITTAGTLGLWSLRSQRSTAPGAAPWVAAREIPMTPAPSSPSPAAMEAPRPAAEPPLRRSVAPTSPAPSAPSRPPPEIPRVVSEPPRPVLPAPEAAPAVPPPSQPGAAAAGASLNLRLGHWIQRGTLQVWLDGSPLLSDEFAKRSRLAPYHTSSWEGIAVPPGRHEIKAEVAGAKGKVYASGPLVVELQDGQVLDVRMVLRDDELRFKMRD